MSFFLQKFAINTIRMDQSSHNTEPELLLWKMTVNDDKKAFEKIFRLFYQPLIMYAKKFIEEQPMREDIIQDVFTSLWEDRKKLFITGSVHNYLISSVKHHCLNHLRREGLLQNYQKLIQENTISDQQQDADNVYLLTELYELLGKALSRLPDTYRKAFEMHRLEGINYEEIAQKLNISIRTAKRYKSQVTDQLKKDLKDYLPLLPLYLFH